MGFLFKILLLFLAIYFLLGIVKRLFLGNFKQAGNNPYNKEEQKEPESQEDRILDYQKKKFESAHAEDVEFEEIKHKGISGH